MPAPDVSMPMPSFACMPAAPGLRRRMLSALAVAALGGRARAAAAPVLVAAASDLKFALDAIGADYQRASGVRINTVYGSSGQFFQQIVQGAPFELFMSADEALVLQLAQQGLTLDQGELYAIGRLVLFAPRGASWRPDEEFEGLRRALVAGQISRFAIANPEHAPYGRAAREALQRAGLWEALLPRLVLGENVAQAAQFATSGSAQGGVFALSLAIAPALAEAGRHVTLPARWHAPLRQRMVLTKKAGAAAQAFHRHLLQPEARALLRRYGFAGPGEG